MIATEDHLIKKEVILIHQYFPANGVIVTDPDINLLCHQQIEEPALSIFANQLWIHGRVTMLLTKCMCFFVLGFEVEHIDSKADVGEVRIQLDILGKGAIVVEEDVIWFKGFNAEDALDELRDKCSYRDTCNSLCPKHRIPSNYHPTWCNSELLIVSSGARELCMNFLCVGWRLISICSFILETISGDMTTCVDSELFVIVVIIGEL